MASLDEDIDASDTTVLRKAPWLRLGNLPERLADAKFAPEAFRKELQEAIRRSTPQEDCPQELLKVLQKYDIQDGLD